MAKVLASTNMKGGVGKSTIATGVAAGLAKNGERVLLIDTDPQEGNATFFCGVPHYSGFYDLVVREADWRQVIKPVPSTFYMDLKDDEASPATNLFICGSNLETRNIPLLIDDTYVLADRLKELDDVYDWIIIDTSPTPGLLATTINIAADHIIYPTTLEVPSVAGLKASIEHQKRAARMSPVDLAGIVPVMARMNTWEHQNILEHLQETYGDLVWEPIPMSIVWPESSGARLSVYAYEPGHSATEHLDKIVARVEGLRDE